MNRRNTVRLRSTIAGIFVFTAVLAGAQDDGQPIVRAHIEPETGVTVGQPVRLIVEVLVPTWFTGAPRYPEIDLPDAIVLFQETGGFNFSDRIGAASYAGQRREYLIYPQRPGGFTVSGTEVIVSYAVNARPSSPTPLAVPEVGFEATVPDEAAGLDTFIASTDLTVESRLDRPIDDVRVGDSFTRTFTLRAADTFSMMLPPLVFDPIEGLAVYPEQPLLSDSGGERGEKRVANRVEVVTYVMRQEGEYRLPEVEIVWWDSVASRLRTATVPPIDFSVAPNPALIEELPPPLEAAEDTEPLQSASSWQEILRRWAVPLAVTAILAWFVTRFTRIVRHRLRALRAESRRGQEESEKAFFARFRKACLSGDPRATFRHLMRWLDRFDTQADVATLRRFHERSGDEWLTGQIRDLSDRIYSPHTRDSLTPSKKTWSGRRFYRSVWRVRKALTLTAQKQPTKVARDDLAPLNPRVC